MKDATPEQKQLGFRIHALAFVPGVLAMLIVNYFTGAPPWSLWASAGWVVGLFCHWFFVLGPGAGKAGTT